MHKFSPDGKLLLTVGKPGVSKAGPDTLIGRTSCVITPLLVADRTNNRVSVFDMDMNYVDDWKHFGRPSGVWVLKDDTLLVSNSESSYNGFRPAEIGPSKPGENIPRNAGWKNGIRIGIAKDRSLKYFIPTRVSRVWRRMNRAPPTRDSPTDATRARRAAACQVGQKVVTLQSMNRRTVCC